MALRLTDGAPGLGPKRSEDIVVVVPDVDQQRRPAAHGPAPREALALEDGLGVVAAGVEAHGGLDPQPGRLATEPPAEPRQPVVEDGAVEDQRTPVELPEDAAGERQVTPHAERRQADDAVALGPEEEGLPRRRAAAAALDLGPRGSW